MDSLQLSELQTFFSGNNNKGEQSSKFSVDSIDVGFFDCSGFDQIQQAARIIDLDEFARSYDSTTNISIPNFSSDYSEHQSLPQVVLGATALVHQGNHPIESSAIPAPVVNFLEPVQSPGESDITSYYSDDSSSTTQHMPEFSQLTSPGSDAPSTSFQYPLFNNRTIKNEDYEMHQCHASQYGTTSESASLPFVTSPTSSIPSPASTIYSVSSPGTPGPSTRGRRPNSSTAPYSTKTPRRRLVEKGTEEYVEKRARNNVAVRKSRAKAKEKQKDTEGRVKALMDHNDQLQKKVDLLSKELTVLKGLFMNVGASIPDEFLSLIEDS